MLVAAPYMANIGLQSKDDNPGILYKDLWDLTVLEPSNSFLNTEEPHCPVLAASEGLSCSTAYPTPQLYLKDARPLFSPLGNSSGTRHWTLSIQGLPLVLFSRTTSSAATHQPAPTTLSIRMERCRDS
jgi:hypothetical protein